MVRRMLGLIGLWLLLMAAVMTLAAWLPGHIVAYDGYCSRDRRATCLLDMRTGVWAQWAPHLDTYGDWLPDMSRVLYSEGYPATIKARTASTSPAAFIQHDMNVILPRWSPDGTQIAYFSALESDVFGLHVTDDSGTPVAPGVLTDGVVQRPPLWSPGGTHLLFFVHPITGAGFRRDIWLYDVAAGRATQVDRLTNGGVSWSPDGARVVYAVSRRGGTLLRVADLNGTVTQQIRVTEPPEYAIEPVWSPDGAYVAYLAQHQVMSGVSKEYLEVYNFRTGEARRLLEPAFDPVAPPYWVDAHTLLQPLTADTLFQDNTGFLVVDIPTGRTRRYNIPRLRQFHRLVEF